jgi:hypothetical protein
MDFQSMRLKKLKFRDVQKPTKPTLMKLELGLKFVSTDPEYWRDRK